MNYSEAQRLGAEIERDGFILVNMLSVGNDYAVEMQVKDREHQGVPYFIFSPEECMAFRQAYEKGQSLVHFQSSMRW